MKPVIQHPDLIKLARLLEDYEEILQNHTQAKIISLSEYRRILEEYAYLRERWRVLNRKAIYG